MITIGAPRTPARTEVQLAALDLQLAGLAEESFGGLVGSHLGDDRRGAGGHGLVDALHLDRRPTADAVEGVDRHDGVHAREEPEEGGRRSERQCQGREQRASGRRRSLGHDDRAAGTGALFVIEPIVEVRERERVLRERARSVHRDQRDQHGGEPGDVDQSGRGRRNRGDGGRRGDDDPTVEPVGQPPDRDQRDHAHQQRQGEHHRRLRHGQARGDAIDGPHGQQGPGREPRSCRRHHRERCPAPEPRERDDPAIRSWGGRLAAQRHRHHREAGQHHDQGEEAEAPCAGRRVEHQLPCRHAAEHQHAVGAEHGPRLASVECPFSQLSVTTKTPARQKPSTTRSAVHTVTSTTIGWTSVEAANAAARAAKVRK